MFKQVNGIKVQLTPDEVSEIEAAEAVYISEAPQRAGEAIDKKRSKEYPHIGDQLDAILKGFEQLRANGNELPDELDAVIQTWRQVKLDNPK